MKIVHVFSPQRVLLADKAVSDDYQLTSNESFKLPSHVMYSINYQPIGHGVEVTPEQELLMMQSKKIVSIQSMVMSQNQANAKLQAINQQQANQIKQLQQMVMNANQQQAVAKSKEEK